MKKIIKIIIFQCLLSMLLLTRVYAFSFSFPFFNKSEEDIIAESIKKEEKQKKKELEKIEKESIKKEEKEKKEQEKLIKQQEKEIKKQNEIEEKNKNKDYLSVETNIHYRNAEKEKWSEQNEFKVGDTCYIRIESTAKYDKFLGESEDIETIYKFSDFNNCEIINTEGKAEKIVGENNVIEFKKKISANKKGKEENVVLVFRCKPNVIGTITLDVLYGDNVKDKYDCQYKIIFN